MARQVWPAPEIAKKSREVVFLSVYRYAVIPPGARADGGAPSGSREPGGKDAGRKPAATDPSDWAIRLDVMGYPQFRLLDGWGRPTPASDAHVNARDVRQVLAAADAARPGDGSAPSDVRLPAALLDRVPKDRRGEAAGPDPDGRVRAWRRLLGEGKWEPKDLALLFEADPDPVVRMEVLARIPPGKAPPEVIEALRRGVDGPNDYVRSRALELLGTAGKEGAPVIRETLRQALKGGTAWKNPNNVLVGALGAAEKCADPSLVEELGKTVRTVTPNNTALLLATSALAAVGKAHGIGTVREHLLAARGREDGPFADRVRRIVDAALGK